MHRFKTLLLREWMQHQRGWLVLMLLPPVLLGLLVPFGTIQIGPMPPTGLMIMALLLVPLVVLGIAAAAALIQAPGLARRDQQDRSIEFWLSLPTGHSASVGAPILMHALLVPWLALAVGTVLSLPIGLAVVAKVFGATALSGLPWESLLVAFGTLFLRAVLGVLLACAWLMPLLLMTMAASAWLKRWGVPLIVVVFGLGHALLNARYGITIIDDTFQSLLHNAGRALIHDLPDGSRPLDDDVVFNLLADAPRWLAQDALAALRDLAQPIFAFALATSVACFGLLVLRRSRAG